jgi:FkbM family methyltransferase
MTAASIVGAEQVSTFDANPDIVADARANFERNGLSGIHADVALLQNRRRYTPGQRQPFYIAEAFWASRLHADPNGPGIVKTVEIPVLCLEDEIARSRANAMVIDIEGGEADLLTQADLSPIRLIIMETHYANVGERAIDAMIGSLIGGGFSIDLIASKDQVVVLRKHELADAGALGG